MEGYVDHADRMDAISDELKGIAQILFLMYEEESLHGTSAFHFLMLSKTVERYCMEISEIANMISS